MNEINSVSEKHKEELIKEMMNYGRGEINNKSWSYYYEKLYDKRLPFDLCNDLYNHDIFDPNIYFKIIGFKTDKGISLKFITWYSLSY